MKVFLLAIALHFGVPHEFYVSILTVRHSSATRTLDLTWRMTAHDIEHALENVAPLKLASADQHPRSDSILFAYANEHLTMLMNGHKLRTEWLGHELDGETLYCFLQVKDVDSLDSLTLSNSLLQDLFYEQQNLVHVERENSPTRSHTFIIGAGPHTFTW